jgi:protein-tyrosine sulfotransferase
VVSSLGPAVATGKTSASAAGSFPDPVFVLCNGRSGSTLLRFLLDAHPELACPPETNVPALCAQLATVWSLIEGAPLSANRGDEPPVIPDAAIAGVRETMDRLTGSYLTRRGKRRYCDKSLGAARYAELLLRIYPQARFICLYRHPMDVIASGMEACPWGLNGYGFDPYIAATPGNAVLALARFWAENVTGTLTAEERFAGHCIRVRYEDLVTDPETTAAGIFDFLGAAPARGIAARCLSPERERERYGPADYKIWHTSRISGDSLGRGWSIPAAMIAPGVLATVNELASRLGYRPVDDGWGTTAPPADPWLPAAADGDGAAGHGAGPGAAGEAAGPVWRRQGRTRSPGGAGSRPRPRWRCGSRRNRGFRPSTG